MWLLNGPGKEVEGVPGWTAAARASAAHGQPDSPLLQPEIVALLETLQQALAPFPRPAQLVAQALAAAAPAPAPPDTSSPPTPDAGTV